MRSEAEIREAIGLLDKHAESMADANTATDVLELAVAHGLSDALSWTTGNDSPSLTEMLDTIRAKHS